MYTQISRSSTRLAAQRRVQVSSRHLATASSASPKAKLSRFEPEHTIDYADLVERIATSRRILNRPLTYAEKVLFAHADNLGHERVERGSTQLNLGPRRVACQDATAQMALIQFMSAGLDAAAVPTTVHCDHLVVGRRGRDADLPTALDAHREVYDFLSSACARYGMGFWKPGAGIIHQTVLENYAFPGGVMVGTDSHTPNAGGGVGGADAVGVMAGLPFELTAPHIIGVRLTGRLSGWATPKDVINKLAGILTVKGGTGSVIEFFGPGTESLSATGMATICNMGAETGATTSVFPYSDAMRSYLQATHRHDVADAVRFAAAAAELRADEGALYDRVVDINLSDLEPLINGPFTPDLSTPVSRFLDAVEEAGWPRGLTAGLIGFCTNSSFQDMSRAAGLAKQALDAASRRGKTLEEDGVLHVFEELGSTLLANACGPCCGSWDRRDTEKGVRNSIVTSYNRNFTGRLDGNPATHVFLASPELVVAKIFSADLAFDPTSDTLTTPSGTRFRFRPPRDDDALPARGYASADHVYSAPPTSGRESVEVQISPTSKRLQRLAPFEPWHGRDLERCAVLVKVGGKCTTDHITPAGPWFAYRGHLGNISDNTLVGAVNADTGAVNAVKNCLTGETGDVPGTARAYGAAGLPWVVVGDENYGEGSSREHAALQPRYLGCVAVLARSFARIHETNLKKQGLLALRFVEEGDYDLISSSDRVSIVGLGGLAPGKKVEVRISPTEEGREAFSIQTSHTLTTEQIEYFKEGSALNLMAKRKRKRRLEEAVL
ncbi:Aconitate hydratase [Colletotrichum sidae]|uniref:Aconitate hydratase, mitochondrial n=1 Tax=Colletotrichum sidae TaxID=1347389 RepID=A0A4R8SQN8_9PEZI|nr:Aconitate hydratase [Colletotrichum sidae]